jgi:hypothetical protein
MYDADRGRHSAPVDTPEHPSVVVMVSSGSFACCIDGWGGNN